jgi:hypothetical protein
LAQKSLKTELRQKSYKVFKLQGLDSKEKSKTRARPEFNRKLKALVQDSQDNNGILIIFQ